MPDIRSPEFILDQLTSNAIDKPSQRSTNNAERLMTRVLDIIDTFTNSVECTATGNRLNSNAEPKYIYSINE